MRGETARNLLVHIRRLQHNQTISIPSESRAWEIHRFNDSLECVLKSELKLTRTRRPPPIKRPNDLLIHPQAVSLNPIDKLMLTGYGKAAFQMFRRLSSSQSCNEFPLTPGRDFAGIVVDSGPRAALLSFPPGTPVMGATRPHTSSLGGGCLSDYILCPVGAVARRPERLDPVLAAAVSYAGLTAWEAVWKAGMDPNRRFSDAPKRVLVTGASGPVGAISAQLAKISGASHVTVTAPSRVEKTDLKISLRVDEVILAPEMPYVNVRYDAIIDCVRPKILAVTRDVSKCPDLRHFEFQEYYPFLRNLESSSSASRYVSVNPPVFQFIDQLGLSIGIGTSLASLAYANLHTLLAEHGSAPLRWAFFEPSGSRLKALADWLVQGQLHVPIEKLYTFDQVPAAFQKLSGGGNNGKIVIGLE
uniref:Reticulon 4 interacting protein 1 n=1 Tax=Echinococcus granulosus TaxID=6210 RepID=A0A068X0G7_ECHGR|nr:reticulon 4 interacting protein 1 [Echinococcus granulosus]